MKTEYTIETYSPQMTTPEWFDASIAVQVSFDTAVSIAQRKTTNTGVKHRVVKVVSEVAWTPDD